MKHVTTMSRNYMTRAISITLILGLLLSSLTFSSSFSTNIWADTDGYWSEYIDTDWYDENEYEYSIGTAEELAGLAYLVNTGIDGIPVDFEGKIIKLTDDIDLGDHYWIPIGLGNNTNYKRATAAVKNKPTDVFKGFFDGQGHRINNMTIDEIEVENNDAGTNKFLSYRYYGLFGLIDSAEIKNVHINTTSQIRGSYLSAVGGICGYAKESVINDCTVCAWITSNDAYYVGGICGLGFKSGINNCTYIGSISATNESVVGGICGCLKGSNVGELSLSVMNNCNNNGDINISSTDSEFIEAGGICGEALYSKINKCTNNAPIKAESNIREPLLAGICSSATNSIITNSSNYGKIDNRSKESTLGGVGAKISTSSIANCANYGEIRSRGYNSKSGGICGSVNENSIIDNCLNCGYFDIEQQEADLEYLAGHICYEVKDSTITNVYYSYYFGDGFYLDDVTASLCSWVIKENSNCDDYKLSLEPEKSVDLLEKLNENNCLNNDLGISVTIKKENEDELVDLVEELKTYGYYEYWVTREEVNNNHPYINNNCWTDVTQDGNGYRYADTSWYYENPNADTYTINTAEELAGLAVLVNCEHKKFEKIELGQDIDLSGHNWEPIEECPSYFYGNNKTIDNMNINSDSSSTYVGLFGRLTSCKLHDLTIGKNSKINIYERRDGDSVKKVGGICGELGHYADIANCTNKSEINVTRVYTNVADIQEEVHSLAFVFTGGICGYFDGVGISKCTNEGDIFSISSQTGGIYGGTDIQITNEKILDCNNTGRIIVPNA